MGSKVFLSDHGVVYEIQAVIGSGGEVNVCGVVVDAEDAFHGQAVTNTTLRAIT
jgi:hypothetical protein